MAPQQVVIDSPTAYRIEGYAERLRLRVDTQQVAWSGNGAWSMRLELYPCNPNTSGCSAIQPLKTVMHSVNSIDSTEAICLLTKADLLALRQPVYYRRVFVTSSTGEEYILIDGQLQLR